MKKQQTDEIKPRANKKTLVNKASQYLFASTLFMLSIAGTNAFAFGAFSDGCFSYPAVAMTPYDVSINEKKYRMTHERVYHSELATGLVLLYGPVIRWNSIFDSFVDFRVTYIDPDGKETNSSVKAELRFVGDNGDINIISTLDSNDFATATNEVQVMQMALKLSQLSRQNGFYVMRMYINRTTTKFIPKAFGYSLCSLIS